MWGGGSCSLKNRYLNVLDVLESQQLWDGIETTKPSRVHGTCDTIAREGFVRLYRPRGQSIQSDAPGSVKQSIAPIAVRFAGDALLPVLILVSTTVLLDVPVLCHT